MEGVRQMSEPTAVSGAQQSEDGAAAGPGRTGITEDVPPVRAFPGRDARRRRREEEVLPCACAVTGAEKPGPATEEGHLILLFLIGLINRQGGWPDGPEASDAPSRPSGR